ncbi:MAG: type VI secretion system membrane subunit TssM [candidate division Zixibacteria bacterium]|nr:type VI secretion system membrane subunit TssM [candidate division Zixibacteria bacterium]
MVFLLNFLRSKAGALGAVILVAILILVIGPMLGIPRFWCYLAVILFVLGALIYLLVKKLAARRKSKMLEGYLTTQAREEEVMARPDLKDEVRALREKLEAAIRVLQRSAGGGRWGKGDALYVLPWYMIIGRPAAGKTTLVKNSGLSFPAFDSGPESSAVRGFGGTRNCDWWFTNEGILLDTAGRYTAEGGAADQAEWNAFLGMLKKARKKAPINGLVLAVGFDELLSRDDVEAEARLLRGKIDELIGQLGFIFPVYLVFTKCDLLHGFVDFFGDLGKKERDEVWGMTFKLYEERRLPVYKEFEEEFDQLYASLAARRNALLGMEKNSQEKQGAYLFPLEFQEIKSKLVRFVDILFESSRFRQDPAVRGIYFTSGTQGEGTVIDAVIGKMSEEMGVSGKLRELLQPATQPKAYFIKELFQRVVLFDRHFAAPSVKAGKKTKYFRLAAVWGQLLLGLGILSAVLVSFFKNQGELKTTYQEARRVRAIGANPMTALENLAPLFRRLEKLDRWEEGWSPLSLHWGLYSGKKANREARMQFLEKLRYALLVPSHNHFQDYLSDTMRALTDLDRYSNIFTAYRMLSEKYDPANQSGILAAEIWEYWKASHAIPPERQEEWQRMLYDQVAYYWKHRADEELEEKIISPNRTIMRLAEEVLKPRFGPKQFYHRLLAQAGARLPALRVEDLVPSGQLLQGNSLPGAFTRKGWEEVVSALFEKSPEEMEKDPILKANVERSGVDIRQELKRLYREDYRNQWKTFFAGVKVGPFVDLEDAIGKIGKLASGNSELFEFLQNSLERGELKGDDFEKQVASDFAILSDLLKGELKGREDKPIRDNYLEGDLAELSKRMQEGAESLKGKTSCGGGLQSLVNKVASLRDYATRGLVWDALGTKEFLQKPFEASKEAAFADACRCLNEVWEEKIRTPFTSDLAARYPFSLGEDAPVARVESFLGRTEGGILWFEEKEIRPAREEGMLFSPEYDSLAARVKNLFSGDAMGLLFTLEGDAKNFRAVSGRGVVQEALFTLGSQPPFAYRMGMRIPWEFVWKPGEPGCELALKVQGFRCEPKTFSGPWALFRLFDEATLEAGRAAWDFDCGGFTCRAEYGLKGDFLERGHFKALKLPEKICP